MPSKSNDKRTISMKFPCGEEMINSETTKVLHHFGNIPCFKLNNVSRSIYFVVFYILHKLCFIFVCVKYFIKKEHRHLKGGTSPRTELWVFLRDLVRALKTGLFTAPASWSPGI